MSAYVATQATLVSDEPRRVGTGIKRLARVYVWITIAASGLVFSEPALCDALMAGAIVLLPVVGLTRFTPGIGFYLGIWAVIVACGYIAVTQAGVIDVPTKHMSITLYLALSSAVMAAFVLQSPRENIRLIMSAYLAAALLAAVAGLVGYFGLLPGARELFAPEDFGRVRGTFKDPNVLGAFLVPVLLYVFNSVLRAIGLLYPETRTLEFLLLGWLAMLVVSWVILFVMVLPERRWTHLRPRVSLVSQELHGSLTLYVKDVSSTVSMFLDRFLVSFFLGLELTGVYTLFWSIANVMHSLCYGVFQAQLPHLIASAQNPDQTEFRALERRLQIQTAVWALLLALAAAIVTPLLLPYIKQPVVQDYLPLFWLILVATLLRILADAYGFSLLALHRDRALTMVALGGALASAGLTVFLTPLAGLWERQWLMR